MYTSSSTRYIPSPTGSPPWKYMGSNGSSRSRLEGLIHGVIHGLQGVLVGQ